MNTDKHIGCSSRLSLNRSHLRVSSNFNGDRKIYGKVDIHYLSGTPTNIQISTYEVISSPTNSIMGMKGQCKHIVTWSCSALVTN